ncbi:MAG: ComF family protein [Limnochordia bacterium]|jgi:ComF family protein|nr:hypothetical protein [Bacillota bacterium]NLL07429.1 ComF family protein [Bacillota bacterium]HBG08434.1 hypothetical protein [Bacillota bacterium]
MKLLREWGRALEQLLFPPELPCGLCRERPALDVGACRACLDSLNIRWEKGAVKRYPYFSLFPYQGFGRSVIQSMKFHGRQDIAVTLGFFLGLASREEPELASVDVLIPVPLAPGRLRERGFNQAALLADNIRGVWKRPICRHVVRSRETRPQSGLPLRDRQRNLRGAFALLPGVSLQGKHCLIVDDVITSGQTFYALARLVEQYGGRPVGLFAARTESIRE